MKLNCNMLINNGVENTDLERKKGRGKGGEDRDTLYI